MLSVLSVFFIAVFPLFAIFVGLATHSTWVELAAKMSQSGLTVPAPVLGFLEYQKIILWSFFVLTVLNVLVSSVWIFKNRVSAQLNGALSLTVSLVLSSLLSVFYLAFLTMSAAFLLAPLLR